LESAGIEANRISHSTNKQWLQFDANVDEVERLLKAEYHSWGNMKKGNDNGRMQ
jgi:tripeptidyl-peptidase-1